MRPIPWLLAVSGFLCLCSFAAQQAPVKPVASVLQLHEAMITPSSDTLFNVGREAPKDDQAWTAVRNSALILAESGNLLMLGSRAKDEGAWMTMSQAMIDAAVAALKAAEAKDVDAVLEAGDGIVYACMNCHEPYRDGRKMTR